MSTSTMLGTLIPNPIVFTCASYADADQLRRYLLKRRAPVTTVGAEATIPGDQPAFALHVLLTARNVGWITPAEADAAIAALEARGVTTDRYVRA